MRLLTLIPASPSIPFMRYRLIGFAISALLLLASLALLPVKGLNYGIDFTGGILLEIRSQQPLELAPIRAALSDGSYGETSLQHFGDPRDVLIRLSGKPDVEQAAIVAKAKSAITQLVPDVEFRRVDYVGPTVGKEMIQSGIMALFFAFLGMLLYIWFRFEWQFGVGALLALIHDAILVFGFFVVTGTEFGLTAIAAILTVIGYSINDSVVIYDRIRENMRKFSKKPMSDIINISLNQTLSRTILTAFTTLLAAGALAWLGGDIIHGFAMALCVGVIVGTYSSIYIAAPILIYFNLKSDSFNEQPA